MIASSPNDFTKMVNMGMKLEEGVREGRLTKEEASSSKKYGGSFSKRKEGETNSVSMERKRRPHIRKGSQSRQHQHQVSSIIPVFFQQFQQPINSNSATTTATNNQLQQ